MKSKIFFLLFIVNQSLLISQSQFMVRVGGNDVEFANSVIQTAGGEYAVAGFTDSFGGGQWDMYIVKLSSSGMLQWTRTVGGTNREEARSIIQTTDGGYAVAGYTGITYYNTSDMLIVKLNANGTLQWARTVGGTGADVAYSITQTQDGGYVAAGYSNSFGAGGDDMYFVKLDASGTIQWSKTLGGPGSDMAFSIIQTVDGGLVAAGFTELGAGLRDLCVVKLNSIGSLQWSRTVGGPSYDVGRSIIQTTDGGYAVAGVTNSFGGVNGNMYILKLDSGATLQWTKTLDAGNDEWANGIIQTADGGYIVAGITEIWAQGDDFACILKLSESGNILWSKIMGGGAGGFASVVRANDGGFAVAGFNWSFGIDNDMYVVKYDGVGGTCGGFSLPSISTGSGGALGNPTLTLNSPNSIITSSSLTTSTGGMVTNMCLVGIEPASNQIPEEFRLYQNYPNPFNPETKIRFSIAKQTTASINVYNSAGQLVKILADKQEFNQGIFEVNFDASGFASGIYFYTFEVFGNGRLLYNQTKKMCLIK